MSKEKPNSLEAAVYQYDDMANWCKKIDWQSIDSLTALKIQNRVTNRNSYKIRRDFWQYQSLQQLKSFFPDINGYGRVCVFSPFLHFVYILLTHTKVDVTWYFCGAPSSMASVDEVMRSHPQRLDVRVVSQVNPAFAPSNDVGAFDLIISDMPDVEPNGCALVLCGAADLVSTNTDAKLMIFSRVPRSSKRTSCLTAAWDVFFNCMAVTAATPKESVHSLCSWWVCFHPRAPRQPPAAERVAMIRRACTSGVSDVDFGAPSRQLLEAASSAHLAVTSFGRKTYKHLQVLPKAQWRKPILARDNAPFNIGLISSTKLSGRDGANFILPSAYQLEARDFRPSCHWGQLKLLLSEVEFLTKCRGMKALDGSVIVYAGAAPGEHIDILIDMFPEAKLWVLFDSAVSTVRSPKAEVHGPGKPGFVTDDTVRALRARLRDERVLFISDIRTRPDEESVSKEMVDQARWGVHLRSAAMLLKFRLPYVDQKGNYIITASAPGDFALDPEDAALIKKPVKRSTVPAKDGVCFDGLTTGPSADVLYLKGNVQLQVFAPPTSTEARLLVVPDKSGKYATAFYDPVAYEGCMNDFNENLRFRGDQHLFRSPLPPEILNPGHDMSWECLQYLDIVTSYLGLKTDSERSAQAAAAPAMRLMREIEERLTAATGSSLLGCTLATLKNRSKAGHHDDTERRIIALWTRVWEVRVNDYIVITRERLLLRGAVVFGADVTRKMVADLDAAKKGLLKASKNLKVPRSR